MHFYVSKLSIDYIRTFFYPIRTLYDHFKALSAPCTAENWQLTVVNYQCYYMCAGKGLGDWNWTDIRVLIYNIKLDFLGFRLCPIVSQSQFIHKTCYKYKTHKMTTSLTSHKSAHYFFSGKNRIREIRKNPDTKIRDFLIRFWEWNT